MAALDPAFPLQRAVYAALQGRADLIALLGSTIVDGQSRAGIYDAIPQPNANEPEAAYRRRVPTPYLTIGDDEINDDSNACAAAWEAFVTIHVWSRAVGRGEAKRIGAEVIAALNVELSIEGLRCTEFAFEAAQYPRDPDGVTTHGILRFRYLLDPA